MNGWCVLFVLGTLVGALGYAASLGRRSVSGQARKDRDESARTAAELEKQKAVVKSVAELGADEGKVFQLLAEGKAL